MRFTLAVVVMFIISIILGPVFYHLWTSTGSINSNFYFAITLVYSLAQVGTVVSCTCTLVPILLYVPVPLHQCSYIFTLVPVLLYLYPCTNILIHTCTLAPVLIYLYPCTSSFIPVLLYLYSFTLTLLSIQIFLISDLTYSQLLYSYDLQHGWPRIDKDGKTVKLKLS